MFSGMVYAYTAQKKIRAGKEISVQSLIKHTLPPCLSANGRTPNNKETDMNLRCSYCQTPFTLGRIEKLYALQEMYAKNLNHYDAHCPRCRRATPVLRQKLEMTMPNWREALQELETEMTAHPPKEAPLPAPEAAPQPEAVSKTEHRKRAGKPVQPPPAPEKPVAEKPAKEKPAAAKPAKEKPAAAKPAKEKPAAKKPATSKPAAKKAK
jgi:hypothetical protein